MNAVMRRMVTLLAVLFGAGLLGAIIVAWMAPEAPEADLWWWLRTRSELSRTRTSAPIADPTFGLLALALVALWVRATWGPGESTAAPTWRARRSEPQPAGADVLADLLGQRRDVELVDLPQMDPEAGGEHVERWRPEDDGRPHGT